MVLTKISEYCYNEKTQEKFYRGYKFGLLVFVIGSVFLSSTPTFAEDEGAVTTNEAGSYRSNWSGPSSTPTSALRLARPRNLANVLIADHGVYIARALGICDVAIKSGTF